MLNQQSVIPALTVGGSHVRFGVDQIAAVIRRGARVPIRPYAALWEARLWIGTRPDDDGCFGPDLFSSESPFPHDSWPFG